MYEFSGVPGRSIAVGPKKKDTPEDPSPITEYTMTPEEIEAVLKKSKGQKTSPLAALTDPAMQEKIYMACRDINRRWTNTQVDKFIRLWNNGASAEQIADQFEKDPDEVVLLIISLAREDKIQKRWVGLYGNQCATPEAS